MVGSLIGVVVLVVGLVVVFRGSSVDSVTARPVHFGAAVVLVALVVGYPLQQFYLSNRYVSVGAGSTVAPKTVAWAQTLTHTRIALGGPFMNLQYPYYGKYLNNYVQFIAPVAPDGAMSNPTCTTWLRALYEGHYDYAITLSPQEQRWTRDTTGTTLLRREQLSRRGTLETFRLDPRFDGTGCRGGRAT